MATPLLARILSTLSPLPQNRVSARFTIALATTLIAILLRAVLDPVLGHVAFYATVYMAVAFVAVVCGSGPAVMSALVGFLGIFYWFVDPRHSLWVVRPLEIHGVIAFFLVCAVLIALGGANRKKQLRLNETIVVITSEAAERRRAEEELQKAHDKLEQRVDERTLALSQALSRLESEVKVRQQAEEQMRCLSVRLMVMQDEERRHIARELHDSAGQALAAIKMAVASLQFAGNNSADFPQQLEDLDALADEALREIRTMSYLLHPPLLDEAGIACAASWFVEGFAKRSGIKVQCDIAENMERPPRDREVVLFRVLQESLTNVHRHSGASAACVTLNFESDRFKLEVRDNGGGIAEERLQLLNTTGKAGVGIAGMRERVRELGGSLDIRSGKTGTIVSAVLPLLRETSGEATLSTSAVSARI
jgi:signal transduction histidine kinase